MSSTSIKPGSMVRFLAADVPVLRTVRSPRSTSRWRLGDIGLAIGHTDDSLFTTPTQWWDVLVNGVVVTVWFGDLEVVRNHNR